MGRAAEKYADLTILTEDNSRFEKLMEILADIKSTLVPLTNHYLEILDRSQAIEHALKISTPHDIILIAGKGNEEYNDCQGKKTPFSDRDTVLQLAKKLHFYTT
ncbi:hypothetical protein [Ligilactobacillus sp. Marseille-Q7487]|uniref:glutamate ligase domain-containing protein n=1 Tax=Ligilactobacillus sp. Marseille-Q7487 TaxID=3022128 RepID=UPI0024A932F1|nr:hypothetical protein [Ligilactobacillus sp. Marseille-Q7487]